MQIWDLPADVDLKSVVVTPKQFCEAVGLSRYRYGQAVQSGTVVFAQDDTDKYVIPPELEIDLMTVTQKQFAAAVGLSRARINQLVKAGVLITSPLSGTGRLMFLASLENFYAERRREGR